MGILQALNWAQKNHELVLYVISESKDVLTAKKNMQNKFGFEKYQAEAIVDMRVRMFTEKEKEGIKNEICETQAKIDLCF